MRSNICFALLLSLLPMFIPDVDADTVFHYLSESRDPVGGGVERTFTPANGAGFQVTGSSNYVYCTISKFPPGGTPQIYAIRFTAPEGTTLAVGDYPNTADLPAAGSHRPGLSFFNTDGSNSAGGQFKILEISFDADGNVLTFAADFATHAFASAPATFGEIRYNSSIPALTPSGAAQWSSNAYTVFETDDQLVVNVTRREGSTGALSVDYATADDTAQAGRDYTATSGTLTWADGDAANKTFTVPLLHPGNPARGNGAFQLLLSGTGAGVQSQASVAVITDDSAITFLHFQSDLGEFLGQGQERTLSIANKFVVTPSRGYNGVVSFSVSNGDYVDFQAAEDFILNMAAAAGAVFGVGDYQGAVDYPEPGEALPQLNFSGDGRGSSALASNFQVLEAVFDDDGNVLKFAANFELHDGGRAPALHGQVRYRSTVLLPPERLRQVGISAGTGGGKSSIVDLYGTPGIFTLTRSGDLSQPLRVTYKVSGSGVSGQDFAPLRGTRKIKAGQASVQVKLVALRTGSTSIIKKTVKLTVGPQAGQYEAAGVNSAKIKIYHYPSPYGN